MAVSAGGVSVGGVQGADTPVGSEPGDGRGGRRRGCCSPLPPWRSPRHHRLPPLAVRRPATGPRRRQSLRRDLSGPPYPGHSRFPRRPQRPRRRLARHRGRPAAASDAPGRRHLAEHGRPLQLLRDPRWRRPARPSTNSGLASGCAIWLPGRSAAGIRTGRHSMVYVRKDVSKLTRTERRRFVEALLELKRRGEYDEFVRLHIAHFTGDGDRGLRVAHTTDRKSVV